MEKYTTCAQMSDSEPGVEGWSLEAGVTEDRNSLCAGLSLLLVSTKVTEQLKSLLVV